MKIWMKLSISIMLAGVMTACSMAQTNTKNLSVGTAVGAASTVENINKKVDLSKYVTDISAIKISPSVKLVGLGEATHGNAEFQTLKKEVFKTLVEQNGCQLFAIEADFGGAYKVNEYIKEGKGTAEEAVQNLSFRIYKTKEMADVLQWMHDYNQKVAKDKQITVYGFDMQRYDQNKAYLLSYLKQVDSQLAAAYETKLSAANDEKDASKEESKALITTTENLMKEMTQNQAAWIKKTSQKEFDFAYQCATCLNENAHLQISNMQYAQLRDGYMKDKVEWIQNYEGGKLLFINGHVGHIMKTSNGISFTTMGSRLAEDYKDNYYAIGTDFIQSKFNSKTGNGGRGIFEVEMDNQLVKLFAPLKENEAFLDFSKASENEELKKMIETKQAMGNIGDQFENYYKISKGFYSLNIVPKEAYDGIIVVKKCTPINLLK